MEESVTRVPSSTSVEDLKRTQVPTLPSFPAMQSSNFPIMHPALIPGSVPSIDQQPINNGPGIYAVPIMPFMGPMAGVPVNTLIPLTYNIPGRPIVPERGAASEEHGQEGRQQPQAAPQRQIVVRRFQFAFQLDLLLLIKLAAVIFIFNQDGSRERLVILLFLAALVYLYQTGFLTPLIRRLTHGMHRVAAPPQPRPVIRGENGGLPIRPERGNAPRPVEEPVAENQPIGEANQVPENENQQDHERNNDGINWWRIVKEIQIVVVGFVTSLLPGFHNVD